MTTPDKDTPLIFVVEDEADIARLIASTLGEYGFRTETFGTGRALLSRARRAQPELAILGLGLPANGRPHDLALPDEPETLGWSAPGARAIADDLEIVAVGADMALRSAPYCGR